MVSNIFRAAASSPMESPRSFSKEVCCSMVRGCLEYFIPVYNKSSTLVRCAKQEAWWTLSVQKYKVFSLLQNIHRKSVEKIGERGKCFPPAFLAYIFQMLYLCRGFNRKQDEQDAESKERQRLQPLPRMQRAAPLGQRHRLCRGTASASNTLSISAGCSRSRRGLRRRNTAKGCGVD